MPLNNSLTETQKRILQAIVEMAHEYECEDHCLLLSSSIDGTSRLNWEDIPAAEEPIIVPNDGVLRQLKNEELLDEISKDVLVLTQRGINAVTSNFEYPTVREEAQGVTVRQNLSSPIGNPAEAIRIFANLSKQLETQEYEDSKQEDFVTVKEQLEYIRDTVKTVFGSDSQYFRELSQVKFRYARALDENRLTYFYNDKERTLNVLNRILDGLRIIYPAMTPGDTEEHTTFPEIKSSLARFHQDYPDALKTAFIMMSFADTPIHREITRVIKQTLDSHGITGVRADDKDYHTDLYPNILTYMHGCGFGLAVFDQLTTDYINPNVAFEVGYMLALNKPVCLLKDITLPNLQADLIGKLYLRFDPQNIEETIDAALSRWITTHLLS